MIAMQYSFTLPADYDMDIIRQRIARNGHLLDDFSGLAMKAYLSADRKAEALKTLDNLYAPFYVWENSEAMNRFLSGPGFAAVSNAFGRPAIKTWSVWQHLRGSDVRAAKFATREIIEIPAFASLAQVQQAESDNAAQDMRLQGALTAVTAFEPASWTIVRLRLWLQVPENFDPQRMQCYEVGHLSLPGLPIA